MIIDILSVFINCYINHGIVDRYQNYPLNVYSHLITHTILRIIIICLLCQFNKMMIKKQQTNKTNKNLFNLMNSKTKL